MTQTEDARSPGRPFMVIDGDNTTLLSKKPGNPRQPFSVKSLAPSSSLRLLEWFKST